MFVVSTTERAKRVARDLRKELQKHGVEISWSKALEAVSRMYGFSDWNELCAHVGKENPSPDDATASPENAETRKRLHVAVVKSLGVDETTAEDVVGRIRPTGRSRQSNHEDLPVQLRLLAEAGRKCADSGKWEEAAAIATEGLQVAAGPNKAPFMRLLENAVPHSDRAAVNLGMAYLIGDAGRKDLSRARALIEDAASRSDDPDILTHAYKILGDIAWGNHGGSPDPDLAVEHWMHAVDHGDPLAAFNIGLYFKDQGLMDEAAEYYETAIDAGQAPSMTNMAGMILAAEIEGTPDRMEQLYRTAARLGDDVAAKALPYIKELRAAAKQAGEARRGMAEGMMSFMRTGLGYDASLWFEILRDHGWIIEDADPKARGEGTLACVAVTADGRRFPVFMSAAAYMAGDDEDPLAADLKRKLSRLPEAVLVFSASGTMLIGRDINRAAVCGGMIWHDGSWNDFFIREGGLDEALRQHAMQEDDPDLDASKEFWSPHASEVAIKVMESRNSAFDGMMFDDEDGDPPQNRGRRRKRT